MNPSTQGRFLPVLVLLQEKVVRNPLATYFFFLFETVVFGFTLF